MTSLNTTFDPSESVPGELNYLGHDDPRLEFSFNEVLSGLQSLDGRERCGLHFQRGVPLPDGNIQMTGDCFCVGGGSATGYICHVYTKHGLVWLTSRRYSHDELFEIYYDCGCDTEIGIFPGQFLIPFDELIDAARSFFATSEMSSRFNWVQDAEMGFDPWCRD